MEGYNQILGKAGEAEAKAFLLRQGYRILQERYWTRFGEIDLIASKGKNILFIEVKWRSQKTYGDPLLAVTSVKIRHLRRAAHLFLWENPEFQKNYRYQLAAIAVRQYETQERIQLVLLPPAFSHSKVE